MAKARSSRKAGSKARKVGKAKAGKARSAKARRVKPARGPAKAVHKPAAVGSTVRERKAPPPVEIPEIPPPLPAPIASFTF
jgi:hypothetical protein